MNEQQASAPKWDLRDLTRIRFAAPLMPEGTGDLVCQLCDEIERLRNQPGAQIESIDGRSVESVISSLLALVAPDNREGGGQVFLKIADAFEATRDEIIKLRFRVNALEQRSGGSGSSGVREASAAEQSATGSSASTSAAPVERPIALDDPWVVDNFQASCDETAQANLRCAEEHRLWALQLEERNGALTNQNDALRRQNEIWNETVRDLKERLADISEELKVL